MQDKELYHIHLKNNQDKKENLLILSLIYIIGVFSGLILTIFS